MANYEFSFDQDLTKPIEMRLLPSLLFTDDNLSVKLTVNLTRNGEEYDISDHVCTGEVLMPNGAVTPIRTNASVEGNSATILLTSGCLVLPGRISAIIRVSKGTTDTVVLAASATVIKTTSDTVYDPDSEVPSLNELLARIEACEEATAEAQEAAEHYSYLADSVIAGVADLGEYGNPITWVQGSIKETSPGGNVNSSTRIRTYGFMRPRHNGRIVFTCQSGYGYNIRFYTDEATPVFIGKYPVEGSSVFVTDPYVPIEAGQVFRVVVAHTDNTAILPEESTNVTFYVEAVSDVLSDAIATNERPVSVVGHSAGELLMVGGKLVKATEAIAAGDTIDTSTSGNAVEISVIDHIAESIADSTDDCVRTSPQEIAHADKRQARQNIEAVPTAAMQGQYATQGKPLALAQEVSSGEFRAVTTYATGEFASLNGTSTSGFLLSLLGTRPIVSYNTLPTADQLAIGPFDVVQGHTYRLRLRKVSGDVSSVTAIALQAYDLEGNPLNGTTDFPSGFFCRIGEEATFVMNVSQIGQIGLFCYRNVTYSNLVVSIEIQDVTLLNESRNQGYPFNLLAASANAHGNSLINGRLLMVDGCRFSKIRYNDTGKMVGTAMTLLGNAYRAFSCASNAVTSIVDATQDSDFVPIPAWLQANNLLNLVLRVNVETSSNTSTGQSNSVLVFCTKDSEGNVVKGAARTVYAGPYNGGRGLTLTYYDAVIDDTTFWETAIANGNIALYYFNGNSQAGNDTVASFGIYWMDDTYETSIAPSESYIAAASHGSGDLFVVGGRLYKATHPITAGDAIAAETNVAETSVAAQLAEHAWYISGCNSAIFPTNVELLTYDGTPVVVLSGGINSSGADSTSTSRGRTQYIQIVKGHTYYFSVDSAEFNIINAFEYVDRTVGSVIRRVSDGASAERKSFVFTATGNYLRVAFSHLVNTEDVTAEDRSAIRAAIFMHDTTHANFAPTDLPTASANHTAGSLMVVEGKLYKATSAIAAGETIVPGASGNVAETSVSEELAARDTAIATERARVDVLSGRSTPEEFFSRLLGANGTITVNSKRCTVSGNHVIMEGVGTNSGFAMFNVLGTVGGSSLGSSSVLTTRLKELFNAGYCYTITGRNPFPSGCSGVFRFSFNKTTNPENPQVWQHGYGLYTYNAETDTVTNIFSSYSPSSQENGVYFTEVPISEALMSTIVENGNLALVLYGKTSSQYAGNVLDLCWGLAPVVSST